MRKTFIAIAALAFAAAAEAQTTIVCESSDGRYRQCQIDGVGRVSLTRQLSRTTCVEGESWGYRDGVVWVDKGCRAEFTLVERGFSNRRGRTLTCESDGGRTVCRTDTRGGVSVAAVGTRSWAVRTPGDCSSVTLLVPAPPGTQLHWDDDTPATTVERSLDDQHHVGVRLPSRAGEWRLSAAPA